MKRILYISMNCFVKLHKNALSITKFKNGFLTAILMIVIASCGPESAFKNASEEKKVEAFEDFIEDYPESELIPKAKERIRDITYWEQIRDTLEPDAYNNYIKNYPDGLFLEESKYKFNDMTAYFAARDSDVVTSYEEYLTNFPSGINKDHVNEKIEKLKVIETSFEQVKNNPTADNLKSFIASNEPSGYTKSVYQVLDNIFGEPIYKSLLQKNGSLPPTYNDLISEIEKSGNKNFRQTREEYLVILMNTTGMKNRPSVPDSRRLIYGQDKSRFSINNATSIKEKTVSARLSGTGNQRMTFEQRTNNVSSGDYVMFTEFKNDLFHIKLNLSSSMLNYLGDMTFTAKDGSIIAFSIPYSINCADGSILRFYGSVYVDGMLVKNSGSEPLTFLLDSEYGWVHLYGSGIVTTGNGEEVKF